MEGDLDQINSASGYYKQRKEALAARDRSENYPHKFTTTREIIEFVDKYGHLEPGDRLTDVIESVAGRVMRVSESSSKLRFLDLYGTNTKIQVFADARAFSLSLDEFKELFHRVHRGDIVGVKGHPGKTKRGELSIFATELQLLSHCLYMLPGSVYGLKDPEIRFRMRYLDLMLNNSVRSIFVTRSRIINFIREYLIKRDFIEVETPMMMQVPGGASAQPFITHHNCLKMDLYLRIAPELYLKRLLIGGMERVFELGKNFRNENIDLTHNPEFTAIEFYIAYKDMYDLIPMTEDMLSSLVLAIRGSYLVEHTPYGDESRKVMIDFTPPYKTIDYIGGIEEELKAKLPRPLDSQECINFMIEQCRKREIELPAPLTAAKLLDKLSSELVEPKCVNPTFVINHPQLMSPLAKWHRDGDELAERAELFVFGKELANFYTELNDPETQREAFLKQAVDKESGDVEAQPLDQDYVQALEYGLPPCAGWGLGIDRLVMFLTDNYNIKEVLLFPAMRPNTEKPAPSTEDGKVKTEIN